MKKETIETTTFISNYLDFEGDNWQNAYFNLLSWKNTWCLPLVLDIRSNSKHEALLYLVVKEIHSKEIKEYLTELGYGNIKEYNGKTLKVYIDYDSIHDEVIAELD